MCSFISNGPLPPDSDLFRGRTEELARLIRLCSDQERNYVILYGAPLTGKTSLLMKLQHHFASHIHTCKIDFSAIPGVPTSVAFEYLSKQIMDTLPGMNIKVDVTSPPTLTVFLRTVCSNLNENLLVLLIEGLGELPSSTRHDLANVFRFIFTNRFDSKFESLRRMAVVFAGGIELNLLANQEVSPLRNVCEVIYLPDLSEDDAVALIVEGLSEVVFDQSVAQEIGRIIYTYVQGHPYQTQLIGSKIVEQVKNHTFHVNNITQIIENILEQEIVFTGLYRDLQKWNLLFACQALIDKTIRFTRMDEEMAQLELLGVTKMEKEFWVFRNPLTRKAIQNWLSKEESASGRDELVQKKLLIPVKEKICILHLSDLHIQTSRDVNEYFGPLKADLLKNLKCTHLDYLVISGDLVNKSEVEEYQSAYECIEKLIQTFNIERNHIVIVPGNHDLNWDLSEQAYEFTPKRKLSGEPSDDRSIPAGEIGILIRNDELYKNRFDYFNKHLYKRIFPVIGYPHDYNEQSILTYGNETDRLLILALNSCWEIDHHYRKRATIHMGALTRVLSELNDTKYDNWLKIAVWHHPVYGLEMINNIDFMEQLAVNGFQICMHGHVHAAKGGFYSYDTERGLHIIGAGTFGAPAREQQSGIPLQYNFLTYYLTEQKIVVETRKKEYPNGAWEADARWGNKNNPEPRYTIQLK